MWLRAAANPKDAIKSFLTQLLRKKKNQNKTSSHFSPRNNNSILFSHLWSFAYHIICTMIIVFARQLNHLCRNTQSWHKKKKKLLHSDLWMPTFVQQDLWKAMSAEGIAATKQCFLLNGTYITETVPWAAPLRACGLPDAVFLAISATSACRDLHLEGEEGGGERRFSSTALPPVPEVAHSSSVNISLPRHRGGDGTRGASLQLCLTTCVHAPFH